jgi:hypothetical protein
MKMQANIAIYRTPYGGQAFYFVGLVNTVRVFKANEDLVVSGERKLYPLWFCDKLNAPSQSPTLLRMHLHHQF